MIPTAKLRFVEREEKIHPFYRMVDANGNMVHAVQTYRVLQQWWEEDVGINLVYDGGVQISEFKGEWRDVPVETEERK